jgi:ADP-heptose:LPS heptosyltransferase
MEKILVSRTDGIGELLLTTPLFNELKMKFPKARISALVSSYASPLLVNNPFVDDIIIYDAGQKDTAGMLKERGFDAVLAVYPRPALAWDFFRAAIPLRYGTSSRWYSFLYNKRVKLSRKSSENHESDYNLMLANELIGEARGQKEYYFISDDERAAADAILRSKGLNGGFIAVHPGSKGSAWNLSEAKYTQLTEALAAAGKKVLLTGGKQEKDMIRRMALKIARDSVHVLNEELGLREFAAVLGRADVLVSGSTGPMHIAAALGVKTASFFPPDSIPATAPRRWGPLGNIHEIIQPEGPGEKEELMETIDTAAVLDKIIRLAGN